MGRGIDLARALGGKEHADLMEDLRDDLLIVFLKRLGGRVVIPVGEVDDTANDSLLMRIDPETREFTFEIRSAPDGT